MRLVLTAKMRAALTQAAKTTLRRTFDDKPGKPLWPVHSATIYALVNRGFLEHDEVRNRHGYKVDVWTITDAGREALNPPPRVARAGVQHLRVPGGSTRIMQRGEWVDVRTPEPEAVRPAELWNLQSGVLHIATRRNDMDERFNRPLTPDERYRELLELARNQGVDIRADDRVIRRRLNAMERKLRQRAA